MPYDARNPAQGVTVYGVPRAKVSGLSLSQANGLRRVFQSYSACSPTRATQWGMGVMHPAREVQCVKTGGGGLPPAMVVAKGDTRSSNHRRRSPKMGPRNTVFCSHMPSRAEYEDRLAGGKLRGLRSLYIRIKYSGVRGDARLEDKYERIRRSFLMVHGDRRHDLFAMERQVDATIKG